jgi:hypothetical protein
MRAQGARAVSLDSCRAVVGILAVVWALTGLAWSAERNVLAEHFSHPG